MTSWLLLGGGLCLNVFIAGDSELLVSRCSRGVLQVEKLKICCDETLVDVLLF